MKKNKVVVLLVLVCVCITYVFARYMFAEREYAKGVTSFMQLHGERVQNAFNRSVEGGMILESLVRYLDFDFDKDTFDYVAEDWFNENTMISISYMPEGVVQWIYPPTKDNNNVLGLNVFEFEGTRKGALESKNNKSIMISGPIELQSGELGLTVRTPIYTNQGSFWGFVSVLYDSKMVAYDAIEANSIEGMGYKFAIHSNYDGNVIPLLASDNFDYEKAYFTEVTIAENDWEFYLYSEEYERQIVWFFVERIIEAIGLCAMIFMGVMILQKRQKLVYEQIYLDQLTRLYNRKKMDAIVGKEKDSKKGGFSIFYIDLNKFKPVNDMYGHAVGDKLLIAFASRLIHRFDESATRIRMGGDEFVLIIDTELDEDSILKVKDRIVFLAEEEFFIDHLTIRISASIGFATSPKDGTTIAEVLEKADNMMYEEKQKKKESR